MHAKYVAHGAVCASKRRPSSTETHNVLLTYCMCLLSGYIHPVPYNNMYMYMYDLLVYYMYRWILLQCMMMYNNNKAYFVGP